MKLLIELSVLAVLVPFALLGVLFTAAVYGSRT